MNHNSKTCTNIFIHNNNSKINNQKDEISEIMKVRTNNYIRQNNSRQVFAVIF